MQFDVSLLKRWEKQMRNESIVKMNIDSLQMVAIVQVLIEWWTNMLLLNFLFSLDVRRQSTDNSIINNIGLTHSMDCPDILFKYCDQAKPPYIMRYLTELDRNST